MTEKGTGLKGQRRCASFLLPEAHTFVEHIGGVFMSPKGAVGITFVYKRHI